MRLLAFLSLLAFGAVLIYVNPEETGAGGKAIFYLTLGLFLGGFLNMFLLLLRRKMIGNDVAIENAGLSFRQGFLLSILVIGLLILQSFRMLVWWDGLLAVAAVFLVELYFLSRS